MSIWPPENPFPILRNIMNINLKYTISIYLTQGTADPKRYTVGLNLDYTNHGQYD